MFVHGLSLGAACGLPFVVAGTQEDYVITLVREGRGEEPALRRRLDEHLAKTISRAGSSRTPLIEYLVTNKTGPVFVREMLGINAKQMGKNAKKLSLKRKAPPGAAQEDVGSREPAIEPGDSLPSAGAADEAAGPAKTKKKKTMNKTPDVVDASQPGEAPVQVGDQLQQDVRGQQEPDDVDPVAEAAGLVAEAIDFGLCPPDTVLDARDVQRVKKGWMSGAEAAVATVLRKTPAPEGGVTVARVTQTMKKLTVQKNLLPRQGGRISTMVCGKDVGCRLLTASEVLAVNGFHRGTVALSLLTEPGKLELLEHVAPLILAEFLVQQCFALLK